MKNMRKIGFVDLKKILTKLKEIFFKRKKEESYSNSLKPEELDFKEKQTHLISMDNALINAAQNLLLSEKRILMLAISKLNQEKKYTEEEPIFLDAQEFATMYQVEINTAYEQIQNACKSIIKKQIYWYENTNKKIEHIEINWISYARYTKKKGIVEISFTTKIQKYLQGLTKHFTTYKLQQASALRSIYSWRLLELLMQFKKTGWRKILLEEFSTIMQATEKQKKDFSKIRQKIIEPAVKELKEKENWEIELETIKEGRKVKYLIFKFKKNYKI